MSKDEKKKQRRIKGDAFWKLNGYLTKAQKDQEELGKWQQKMAEEAVIIDPVTAQAITGVYPDLINWHTGSIFSDTSEIVNGIVRNGKVAGRLDKKVIAEYQKKMEASRTLNEEVTEYRNKLAKILKVFPEQVDWKTGKVDSEEFDGVELPENLDDWEDTEPIEPEADKPEK